MKNKKINYQGFTLVELLVVIAIIGILASVVLVSLNSARAKARDARRISDLHQVSLALESYNDSNQNYPATIGGVANSLINPPAGQTAYLSAAPKDPQTATDYKYAALGSGATCSSYHLGAILENTSAGPLTTDADAAAGTACAGSDLDFNGNSPDCISGTPDKCYDVKP